MNVESRKRLESHLAELEKFLNSPVHQLYVKGTQRMVETIEARILEDEILSEADLYNLLSLRGERRVLRASLLSFEDSVANLKDQIEHALEEENETLRNQEKSE